MKTSHWPSIPAGVDTLHGRLHATSGITARENDAVGENGLSDPLYVILTGHSFANPYLWYGFLCIYGDSGESAFSSSKNALEAWLSINQ